MVRMADRTLVENRLEMLDSIVQVRDCLARPIFGKSCVTCICVSSNLAVDDGLQLAFSQQKKTTEAGATHIKQSAVLIVARMYNGGRQRKGRIDTMNGWEGQFYEMLVLDV